jgi:hypothetical protein
VITILVYDRGMPVSVNLQTVHHRKFAAVRREVPPGAVGSAWGPALGMVWKFIRSQPGLRLAQKDCQPRLPCRQSVGAPIRRPPHQRIPQNLHSHPRYGIS